MLRTSCRSLVNFVLAALVTSTAFGQPAPPPASSLEDVTSCVLDGNDVFIGTGRGAEARRYKYPWDASVDAICNAKGFAIAAPPKSSTAAPSAPRPAAASSANAQATDDSGFPAGARRLEAGELTQLISGRVAKTFFLDGRSAGTRVQYEPSGLVYINTPTGSASGRWRVEGSAVCFKWNLLQGADGCTEVRLVGDRVHARRANGEIVRLEMDK